MQVRVSQVTLFGSLVHGGLHERSDVDVAVAGLPPERYFEALWRCEDAVGRHVDLVRVEEASLSMLARISAEGERLHG